MNNSFAFAAISIVAAFALAGCGGGGSDDTTTLPNGFDCSKPDITPDQKAECDKEFPPGTTGGVSNSAVTSALGNAVVK